MKFHVEKCGICGEKHALMNCDIIHLQQHIVDKPILPRARITLPDELKIVVLADCTYSVHARCHIQKGTQFGPFQAKKLCSLLPTITFPLKIFSNNEEELCECYLDTSDENECSWMMYVAAANNFEEQNLICFQDQDELFYVTVKDITEGEALKVWYSPYYALMMKKELLIQQHPNENQSGQPVDELVEKNKNVTTRESWSCKFCGKVENKVVDFAVHLLGHYKSKMKKKCEKCGDSFSRSKDLQNHVKLVHGTFMDIKEEISSTAKIKILNKNTLRKDSNVGGPLLLPDLDQESLDNSNPVLGPTGTKQFELGTFADHGNLLENEQLSLNMDSILLTDNVKELGDFNFELNESESEQLVCDLCLKNFQKLHLLIVHLAQHTGKFTCLQCNKVFTRKENLHFHPCTSFYNYKCSSCDKLFYQKKALTHHINYYHEKVFLCKKCNINFTCKKKLNDHTCSTDNFPTKSFSCHLCSKVFTQKNNLTTHMKKHANPNDTYTCPICHATLNSRLTYLKHEKIHYGQGYKCEKCDKVFARRDSLKYHIQVVHQRNEQVCPECNKVLSSKKQLKKHMITHQTEKNHKCTQCQRAFKIRQHLIRHITAVHNSSKQREIATEKCYSCPKCETKVKFKQSLLKHMRKHHPGQEQTIKVNWRNAKNSLDNFIYKEDSELDLKQTIDNMNFNTDDINSYETEINLEIDKLLNSATNMDPYLDESNERLVDRLINIAVKDNPLLNAETMYQQKNVCLSMPELTPNT